MVYFPFGTLHGELATRPCFPLGIGFKLSDDDDYHMKCKKPTNCLNPEEDSDASKKPFVMRELGRCLTIQFGKVAIDANDKRIENVADLKDHMNAITKRYLETKQENLNTQ